MSELHKHHRKRRSQGGTDDPSNIIHIPSKLHTWIHENPEQAYELGLLVKSYEEPEDVSVKLPENLVKTPRQKKEKEEKPRRRTVWSIKVPKDSENGVEALETLLAVARDALKGHMGWQDDVPVYYVLAAVLADWVNQNA